MTAVTALLHRAARHGITIAWDIKRKGPVIFPTENADPRLLRALDARAVEIAELLSGSGFWECPCPQCRGTVH